MNRLERNTHVRTHFSLWSHPRQHRVPANTAGTFSTSVLPLKTHPDHAIDWAKQLCFQSHSAPVIGDKSGQSTGQNLSPRNTAMFLQPRKPCTLQNTTAAAKGNIKQCWKKDREATCFLRQQCILPFTVLISLDTQPTPSSGTGFYILLPKEYWC